jgi:predicted NBD/HSP70 family sugar kinase
MRSHVASDLKVHNRKVVYDLIRSRGELSKAEITRSCGISAPTVIKIIDYFTALGLVGEAGSGESALGRKPMLIRFDPCAAYAVGTEYDGVHLSVGLVDLSGRICALLRTPAPPDLRDLLGSLLAREVEELIAGAGLPRKLIRGICVGVPGAVNQERRVIGLAPLVGIMDEVDYAPLAAGLESALGFPVLVANDANAAALGEFAARGRDECGDLVFVELGRGLGAGLILDGQLRTGPRSSSGEIGYMAFESGAGASVENPGWLEARMDLATFWAEAESSGEPSFASLDRVASLLALALANICIALDIDRVVVGRAGRESFGPAFLGRLRAGLERLCPMPVSCEPSRSAEPGVAGAAALAAESWLGDVFAG